MRLSHAPARISIAFDDPNLVSHGGLVPVMALAERAGLLAIVDCRDLQLWADRVRSEASQQS